MQPPVGESAEQPLPQVIHGLRLRDGRWLLPHLALGLACLAAFALERGAADPKTLGDALSGAFAAAMLAMLVTAVVAAARRAGWVVAAMLVVGAWVLALAVGVVAFATVGDSRSDGVANVVSVFVAAIGAASYSAFVVAAFGVAALVRRAVSCATTA